MDATALSTHAFNECDCVTMDKVKPNKETLKGRQIRRLTIKMPWINEIIGKNYDANMK